MKFYVLLFTVFLSLANSTNCMYRLKNAVSRFLAARAYSTLKLEDAYKILGISANTELSQEELKKIHKRKAFSFNPFYNMRFTKDAEEKFKKINTAYSVVSQSHEFKEESEFDFVKFEEHANNEWRVWYHEQENKENAVVSSEDIAEFFKQLYVFIQHNNIQMIDLLCKKGVDVNLKDADGNAPIFYASTVPMIRELTTRGADTHIRNSLGESLLHNAVRCYDLEVIKEFSGLIEDYPIDRCGRTVWHMLVEREKKDNIEEIIEYLYEIAGRTLKFRNYTYSCQNAYEVAQSRSKSDKSYVALAQILKALTEKAETDFFERVDYEWQEK